MSEKMPDFNSKRENSEEDEIREIDSEELERKFQEIRKQKIEKDEDLSSLTLEEKEKIEAQKRELEDQTREINKEEIERALQRGESEVKMREENNLVSGELKDLNAPVEISREKLNEVLNQEGIRKIKGLKNELKQAEEEYERTLSESKSKGIANKVRSIFNFSPKFNEEEKGKIEKAKEKIRDIENRISEAEDTIIDKAA